MTPWHLRAEGSSFLIHSTICDITCESENVGLWFPNLQRESAETSKEQPEATGPSVPHAAHAPEN
jgi:hypothetical protein